MRIAQRVAPYVALLALVATLAVVMLAGCDKTKQVASTAEHVAIGCAEQVGADDLLPGVLAILQGAGSSWAQQLEALGTVAGEDALACALREAADAIRAPKSVPTTSTSTAALTRYDAFVAAHGWRFR